MGRAHSYSAALAAAVMLSSALIQGAAAQGPVRDYYQAGANTSGAQMLRNLDQNHYRGAARQLELRRYESAISDLEFMLNYVPNHPQALAGIAQVSVGLKRPDLADQYFKNAIRLYPEHDETFVIYGVFLHRLGRMNAAITQYKKALDINPNSVVGHYNLGLAYVDTKAYSEANIHAQHAYRGGMTLPGLKRQLEAANAWKPASPSGDVSASPDSASSEGKPN